MKKFVQTLACFTAFAFVGNTPIHHPVVTTAQAVTDQTQSDVFAEVKKALHTPYPITLPTVVPVASGKYLTAKTTVTKSGYKVVYYETAQKVAVNASKLDTISKHVVARVQLKHYRSKEAALAHVGYENYAVAGGRKVALGYDIQGYQDAGAGQLYTAWNEGRWAFATHTYTNKSAKGLALAKRAVTYLETHMLPAPDDVGAIRLDAVSDENYVALQQAQNIVTVDKVQGIQLLKVATSIH